MNLLKRFPRAIPMGFIALVLLAMFWKLTLMRGVLITDDIFTGDLANGHLPYFHFLGESLKNGEMPLWIPSIYSGFPFMGGGSGQWYPFNLVLFWVLPSLTALNLSLLLTLLIAAESMYLYAREIGADMAGSVIAAMSFALSGFMVSHLKHVPMVQSVCWAPLGMLLIERSIRLYSPGGTRQGLRVLLWLAPVFAVQNLSGFTQTVYYSGLLYGSYFLFRLVRREREIAASAQRGSMPTMGAVVRAAIRSPLLYWFVGIMALSGAMSAIQILPTLDLVAQSGRGGGVSYEYATHFGYDPKDIAMFVYPLANGDIGNGTYTAKGIFWEDYGYVGIITLLLAVIAVARSWKSWYVRFLSATALLAFLLVLGKYSFVFDAAFRAVPGMNYFRFSTRFLFVVDACLALLAALGTTSIAQMIGNGKSGGSRDRSPHPVALLLVIAVIADLLIFQTRQNAIVDIEKWATPPHTAGRILEDTTRYRIYSPGASETHKVAWRMAGGWQGDLQPYVDQREFLQVNSNVLYGLSSPEGYIALAPAYVVDLWGDMNRAGLIMRSATVQQGRFVAQPSFVTLMNLFNVRYILMPWQIVGAEMELLDKTGGVFLYRNPTTFPRAFVVGRVRHSSGSAASGSLLLSPDFDPRHEVILEEPVVRQLDTNHAASHAEIVRYRNNEVEIRVTAAGAGMLVLADTYFPGWRATVDGSDAPIMRANLCQRAVPVPAGDHVVRFAFEPTSFRNGMYISIASLLLFCVGVLAVRRKRE
jgi:hypothetical protein